MPLIKNGQESEHIWLKVSDEEPASLGRPVIVSLERWQAERATLAGRNAPLGIVLRSDQPPALIAEDLAHFELIALEFPKFSDGRGYSYARLLRERYGFTGELRAVGEVLQDQLLFLDRCGFDAVEMTEPDAEARWQEALGEISVWYQPTADGRKAALSLRHRRQLAAKAEAGGTEAMVVVSTPPLPGRDSAVLAAS